VNRDVEIASYSIELFAKKVIDVTISLDDRTTYIFVKYFNRSDIEEFHRFSKNVFHYASGDRKITTKFTKVPILSVPIIVLDSIETDVKVWVEKTVGKRHPTGWEFPLIYSFSDQKVFSLKKAPIFGYLIYKNLLKRADSFFLMPKLCDICLHQNDPIAMYCTICGKRLSKESS